MTQSFKYHAFISYRHADNKESGRQWATWLHQAIETYEVPFDLVGKINGRDEEIPKRIYPIFRDEEELPAHADLGQSITKALDSTQLLIVLCSPNAVASTYVADEIDYFKKQGGSDRIIAAMINGEPNTSWDKGKQKAGFKVEDECFPIPLQFEYDEDGNRTEKHAEPIAADFRINNNGQPEQAWTSPESYRKYLKDNTQSDNKKIQEKIIIYQQQQHLMLLKIIAGILGVPLGELTQRDKVFQLEQERLKAKRLRKWLSAVAILAIVAIGAGAFAFIQREEALDQKNAALETQSRYLSGLARKEQEKGYYDRAILLMLNAIPGLYGGSRPSQPRSTFLQLKYAALKNSKLGVFQDEDVKQASISPDGKTLLTSSFHVVALWSIKTGKRLYVFEQEGNVNNAAFSPDGQTLLIVFSEDTVATLWSVETGKRLQIFEHKGSVNHAVFSSNGEMILTASDDTTAALWSVKTGKRLQIYKHEGSVKHVVFSPDGKTLVSTFYNYRYNPDVRPPPVNYTSTAALWSIDTGKRLQIFKHDGNFTSTAFSSDGEMLLTKQGADSVVLWSVKTGQYLQVFKFGKGSNPGAEFSPDGRNLVINLWNVRMMEPASSLWSVKTGEHLWGFKDEDVLYSPTGYMAFSDDGAIVAIVEGDNTVSIWLVNTETVLQELQHEKVNHVSFSPDGKTLITASEDNTAILWSVKTGKRLQVFQHYDSVTHADFSPDGHAVVTISDDDRVSLWKIKAEIRHGDDVVNVSFSPDGQTLATASVDNTAALWSVKTGLRLQTFEHESPVFRDVFSIDGQALLTVSLGGTAALWSVKTGQRLQVFKHEAGILDAKLSPNEEMLLTAVYLDNHAVLWSVKTGQHLKIFTHQDKIRSASFSPDGQSIVTASEDGTAAIWSIESGKRLQVFQHKNVLTHEIYSVTRAIFNPDGRTIATASETGVALWSVRSGDVLQAFNAGNGDIISIGFSPDGNILVTASETGIVLWSVKTGEKLQEIHHVAPVSKAIFSSDGQTLISQSGDLVFRFSVKTGERLQSFKHIGLKNFTVSPDEQFIATVSEDNTARLWPISPTDIMPYAINQLPKNRTCLTPEEREQFFLSNLTDEQWIERGCSQYAKSNRYNY